MYKSPAILQEFNSKYIYSEYVCIGGLQQLLSAVTEEMLKMYLDENETLVHTVLHCLSHLHSKNK